MSEFETKPGSTAEQLEELESARGLIETGGVRSMAVVCVMKSGELSRISSCAPEDWLGLRGGLMTAALGLDGEEVRDGLPEVVIDEEQEEVEAAQVVPIERSWPDCVCGHLCGHHADGGGPCHGVLGVTCECGGYRPREPRG